MTDAEQTEAANTPSEPSRALQSADIGKLADALAKAQSKLEQPQKNKTATIKMKAGGQYSYKYADLPAVIESLKKALSDNGLSYTQCTQMDHNRNRLVLMTKLMHSSGQWVASEWPLEVSKDPKETASSLTYGRRYTLTSLCGISAEETDDDADRRNSGKDEPVIGALTKSALQKKMRAFDTDLLAVDDEDQLAGLLHDYNDALAQCERDLPSWYYTKDGSDTLGLKDRITKKERELADRANAEPSIDSAAVPEMHPYEQTIREGFAQCITVENLEAFWAEEDEGDNKKNAPEAVVRTLENAYQLRRQELLELEPPLGV